MIQPCKDRGGYRKFGFVNSAGLIHCGHDYNCDVDDPMKSVEKGVVVFSAEVDGFGSYGKKGGVIIIRHEHYDKEENILMHFLALYGHINRLKKVGDKVIEGDIIGTIIQYQTVDFRADHLHFCIIVGDVIPSGKWGYREDISGFFDPIKFINSRI